MAKKETSFYIQIDRNTVADGKRIAAGTKVEVGKDISHAAAHVLLNIGKAHPIARPRKRKAVRTPKETRARK